ncbi:hypothetical protein A3Q56_03600 [Intoshia linei]|uniref:Septin n=1 Tax=Intoshia linei TaxID=1819745 RepID=A0A177B4Z9_9BILA|nr:hypothetical protein A3Q56_03600 [Intoshia linei]
MSTRAKGGFVEIQNQMYNKSIDRGFDFNMLIIGQSCLGKTTFINNIFNSKKLTEDYNSNYFKTVKTTEICETRLLLKENGVKLRLNIIDTPGFGQSLNNSNCCDVLMNYINTCYNEAIEKELAFDRVVFDNDPCVHLCLYFISPNSHQLSDLDIYAMKKLHNVVNILPIIAKVDTLTMEEKSELKKRILKDITDNEINIFQFPKMEKCGISKNAPLVPFGIICGDMKTKETEKNKKTRIYPWGTVDVMNRDYNEFESLRHNIFGIHMYSFINKTRKVLYENFRRDTYTKSNQINGDYFIDVGDLLIPNIHETDDEEMLKKRISQMKTVFQKEMKTHEERLNQIESQYVQSKSEMDNVLLKKKTELEGLKYDFEMVSNNKTTKHDKKKKKDKK